VVGDDAIFTARGGASTRAAAKRRGLLAVVAAAAVISVVLLSRGGEPGSGTNEQEQEALGTSVEDATSDAVDAASSETSGDDGGAQPEPSPPGETAGDDGRAESGRNGATLEAVPVEPLVVNDPIDLDATGDFGTGLTVRVLGIESVDGEATRRFEVAGPALRIRLEVTNTTDDDIALTRTQVDVSYGEDRTPGIELSGPDVAEFPTSLAAGERAAAAVVFGVPADERDQVQVVVTHGTEAPVIVFEGSAA
jgi:hypothetical protein